MLKRFLLLAVATSAVWAQGGRGGAANREAAVAPVSFDRILRANQEPQNWLTYSGNLNGNRHSALTQITPANAGNLTLKWVFQSRSLDKHEVTPLVVDGVMYTVQSPNDVIALDAATGKTIWTYSHRPAEGTRNPCCGNLTRGVAILGDKLFLAGLEIDFDRLRGRLLRLAAGGYAVSFALAVIVAGGFVILGRLHLTHIAVGFWVSFAAGIGGLAAALALVRRGVEVTVLEQSAELGEIGAGIQISPNGNRALKTLNCFETLLALSCKSESKEIRLWNTGKTWKLFDLGDEAVRRYVFPYMTVKDNLLMGAFTRSDNSRNCFGVASAGAPISKSSACWFIGNSATSRKFCAPTSSITMRSTPAAIPPCGGASSSRGAARCRSEDYP